MKSLHILALIVIVSNFRATNCDEIVPSRPVETKKSSGTNQAVDSSTKRKNAEVIRQFFERQTLFLDEEEGDDFFEKFSQPVVDKMRKVVEDKDDSYSSYLANEEINSMIYADINQNIGKTQKPFEPADEAILQTLDLIVPDTVTDPVYAKAKKELRKFYEEEPLRGRELLARIGKGLDDNNVQTFDAISFLEGAYHNWIPLGRAADYISKNGSK